MKSLSTILISLIVAGAAAAADGSGAGRVDTPSDGGQPIAAIPWTDATEIDLSPFGVGFKDGITAKLLSGKPPYTRFRGTGIVSLADGQIFDCKSETNWIGARLLSSDCEISRCRLSNNRDAGLWIAAGAGNCQSLNNHFHGARIACYNEGGETFRSTQDTFADSLIGYYGDTKAGGSGQTTIVNGHFQHDSVWDVVFFGWACKLENCTLNVQREVVANSRFRIPGFPEYDSKGGVLLAGNEGSIRGCDISLRDWKHPLNQYTGRAVPAVVVWADDCEITDSNLVDADGLDGSVAVEIAGQRSGLKIDCTVRGFTQANERLISFAQGARCSGLDATFRIRGGERPITTYIDAGADWSGTWKVIDRSTHTTCTVTR